MRNPWGSREKQLSSSGGRGGGVTLFYLQKEQPTLVVEELWASVKRFDVGSDGEGLKFLEDSEWGKTGRQRENTVP